MCEGVVGDKGMLLKLKGLNESMENKGDRRESRLNAVVGKRKVLVRMRVCITSYGECAQDVGEEEMTDVWHLENLPHVSSTY